MSAWSNADLQTLRGILAGLFPRPEDGERIAGDAGIGLSFIDLSGAPIDRWLRILAYANQRDQVDAILSKALAENPGHAALLLVRQQAVITPTSADAFKEVLLPGRRPFINRGNLRAELLDLISPAGASVLLIDGEPQTGKSYSYFLINHVAPTRGYQVNKFSLSEHLQPDQIAGAVLGRLGVRAELPGIGNESAVRWAEKLATEVYLAMKDKPTRHVFVFDDPPTTEQPDGTRVDISLPEGTTSFLVRLATYADEELRGVLRIVLTCFKASLPQDIDDVAGRDTTEPLTPAHMVAAIMQVATAREWSVSQAAVQSKVDEYHLVPNRTLKDSFKFIRGLLQKLEDGAP